MRQKLRVVNEIEIKALEMHWKCGSEDTCEIS